VGVVVDAFAAVCDFVFGDGGEEEFEGDLCFEAGERAADAVVDSVAEGEVAADWPVECEGVGLVEFAFVAVGGPVDEGDAFTCGNVRPVQLDGFGGDAGDRLNRCVVAEELLDRRRYQGGVGCEPGTGVVECRQVEERVCDQAGGRVDAGGEENQAEADRLVTDVAAVDRGERDPGGCRRLVRAGAS
jgi:hypothetical protein